MRRSDRRGKETCRGLVQLSPVRADIGRAAGQGERSAGWVAARADNCRVASVCMSGGTA
jgi:hypothetical protein